MSIARRIAAATAVAALVCVAIPSTAHADDESLRLRAHARVAAIMDDAVDQGIYSQVQDNYVVSAIIPGNVDPKDLPAKTEERTVDQFWDAVAEGSGLSVAQVQARLRAGATLVRLTGDNSENVRDALYGWLSRPAFQAYLEKRITQEEFADLKDDIERSVWRVMAQPGGDRDVVLVPRRN